MNKNTRRKVEAARDAFGRLKHTGPGKIVQPGDEVLAERIGHKPRRYKHPKVGRSGPDIARRLGHEMNPEHLVTR